MATKLNLPDVGTLGNPISARATINSNFTAIENAFDNTLSRDGTSPNQMEADIDLNGNDLLNVRRIDADELYKSGVPFEQSIAYATKKYQLFSGTGAQTNFNLSDDPASLGNLYVSVGGSDLKPGIDYTYSGTTLTFTVAPAAGTNNIYVRFDRALPTGVTEAEAVLYTPPSTGLLGTMKAFLDSLWTAGASTGSALVRFLQSGASASARTAQDKMRDIKSVKDNGAAGDNVADDGAEIATAFSDYQQTHFPSGTYKNATTALTLSFAKTAVFESGASISNSGSGSYTQSGAEIRFGYNPSGQAGWTSSVSNSYEALSADLGGYGARQHGSTGIPTAIGGAVNIPTGANAAPHANGVAGYAKSAATSCGAVALFGYGESLATNALAWGLNTVTEDNNNQTTVWGYECDINVDNVNTTVLGVQVVGGSSVEPALAIGFQVSPINPFTSPKKRWAIGFETQDGSAILGMSIGAQGDVASSASQTFQMYYKNGANVRTKGYEMQVDSAGNMLIVGAVSGGFFGLRGGGGGTSAVTLQGNNLGFFGALPVAKQTSAPNATDLATCITLANALKTGLVNLGLTT